MSAKKVRREGARPRRRATWPLVAVAAFAVAFAVALATVRSRQPAEGSGAEAGSPELLRLAVRVLAERPHRTDAYTQGLVWHGGRLYESTGGYGQSSLRRVDPATGEVERQVTLPEAYFGEGLALVGGELHQLTWREGTAFVWDLESLEERGRRSYAGEGWGLCFHAPDLVMSDGSARLAFLDPASYRVRRALTVTLEGRPLGALNELECAEGRIYANVWQTDTIVRIDPETGAVVATIDAAGLVDPAERSGDEVLNGIAYDPERGVFYLTGKNWPRLFEAIFVPR